MDYDFVQDISSYNLQDQDQETSSQHSDTHRAIASGYLHKLAHGGSVFGFWHRRYYVLYSDGLMYSYHNARSLRSSRTIPVGRLCLRMKFGSETNKSDCNSWPSEVHVPVEQRFSLINTDRSYHFYADSETELSMWKHHLQSTLSRLSSSSQAVFSEVPRPSETPTIQASKHHNTETVDADNTHHEAKNPEEGPDLDNNDDEPYDVVYKTRVGLSIDSLSSSSSEESLKVVHSGRSPVEDMLETAFGEITSDRP